MKSMNRAAASALIALAAVLVAGPSQAATATYRSAEEGPRWEDQVADALIARPVGIVATGAGAVIWTASLPFSLLGGNAGETADKLIGGPGRETFYRCLGCRGTGRRETSAATH